MRRAPKSPAVGAPAFRRAIRSDVFDASNETSRPAAGESGAKLWIVIAPVVCTSICQPQSSSPSAFAHRIWGPVTVAVGPVATQSASGVVPMVGIA